MREMKDSGIEWIGEIPKDWEVAKIKYHLKRNEPKNPGNTIVLSVYRDYGVVPKDSRNDNHNVTSEDTSKYKYVKKGQLVINKMKAWQGSLAVSNYDGIVSPAYFIYDFINEKYNSLYFHYLVRSCYKDEFKRISGGIREGQWDLSPEAFANTLVLLPSLVAQQHIVDFLDTQCSEIDATAEDIQKEISLLEDYKKSVITEAVTKGLNPNVEMKDSGIEWIGEIPKHWKVIKTKYVADISIGLVTTMTANYVDNLDDGVYLIRNGDIRLNKISKEKMVYISRKFVEQNSSRQLLENDIVTVHTGYIGTSAIIRDDFIGSVGFATIQSRPNLNIINERYLCWFYNSSFFIKQCMLHNTGDGRQNLNLYDFVNFYVYQPPLAEQQQIADYLDTKCSEIDTLIADKKRQLDILADYKKSLIYEYVTGKKEVPVKDF